MQTELYFPREATETWKDEVRAAFREEGILPDQEGPSAINALEILGVRIDAAFIVDNVVGGILWDVEKEALRRGIKALRKVWSVSGTVSIVTDPSPGERAPAIYFVPGGIEGDAALDASVDDYEAGATGQRLWLPGVGWGSMEDLDRFQSDLDRAREDASG